MDPLQRDLDAVARESGFSGVLRLDGFATAYGDGITVDTQLAIASGTKGLTAVTIATLIEGGLLELSTTARSLLGDDLPSIGHDVTVEHLLSHTSGIGDYFDEELDTDVDAFAVPVPVGELETTEDYLKVLDGHPTKFAPGQRFSYCNSGYVVLALIAERASGTSFYDLVHERICTPAQMNDTAFLRSDALPESAAIGLLADGRSNVANLPVRGSGVGFWLDAESDMVIITGADAGVSFHSAHSPARGMTYAVLSNTSEGAWPLARRVRDVLRAE